MIRIYETYETVTSESAKDGDVEDRGYAEGCWHFDDPPEEPQSLTFRQCVARLLDGEASSSTPSGVRDWVTQYGYAYNYASGTEESRSYRPVDAKSARWFWKAFNYKRTRKS